MTNVDLKSLIEYDEKADAMYIRLNNTRSTNTGTFKDGIMIDFDKEDEAVGIEVLYVSKRVQKMMTSNNEPKVDIVFFIGMSGSGKDTVAREYAELYGHKKVTTVKYADKLKEYVYDLVHGIQYSPEEIEALPREVREEVRPILISLAKEVQKVNPSFTLRDLRLRLFDIVVNAKEDITILVTDMRTNLELDAALELKKDLGDFASVEFIYIERELFEHELARQVVSIFGINKFSGFLISLFSKPHSVRIELEAASLALRGLHRVVNKEGNPQVTAENVRTILSQLYHTEAFEKSEQRRKLDPRWVKFDL